MKTNRLRMSESSCIRALFSGMMVTVWISMLFAMLFAGQAQAYDVTVKSGASANGAWSGTSPAVWTPSAAGSVVSVSDIEDRLGAGTNVEITSAGSDDLTIASAATWTTNAKLTLSAGRHVHVNAPLTATGSTAGVTITPGAGSYSLNYNGKITLSGATPSLTIAGETYTVINDLTALQNMANNMTDSARYALGSDIDASATSGWNSGAGFVPIAGPDYATSRFWGRFYGQGHIITNIFINRPSVDYVGLFGVLGGSGFVSNVALLQANITGKDQVGSLVGYNLGGSILESYATGTVSGHSYVGGISGFFSNGSSLSKSYNKASVTGSGSSIGGLVGFLGGTIAESYSSGAVSGSQSGGLTGAMYGTVVDCYWDTEASGQAQATYFFSGTMSATGLTTAQAMIQSSYSEWDFGGTWRIYDGHTYPLLKAFIKPVTVTANNATMPYDGTTAWSGGNGVVWSDPAVVSSLSGGPTYTGSSQGAISSGTYAITPGGYWSNQQGYDIDFVDGTLSILLYHLVTPSAGPGGWINPNTPQSVADGTTKIFTEAPDPGYKVSNINGCGARMTAPNEVTTGPVRADCSLSITFTTGLVNGACGTANGQTLMEEPSENLCASGVPANVSGAGPWTWHCYGVNSGTTADCSANIQKFTVTVSAQTSGSISPSTPQLVSYNTTTSLLITPDSGYRIGSVTGCGGSLSGNTYTTGPVITDCSISAQFLNTGNMSAPGNALHFDGTDDYVVIPDADALDLTTSYTIEAWIKPEEFKWLAGIVSKYTSTAPDGYLLRLSGALSGQVSYDGIGFDGMETAEGILQLGVWQHIAAVNDNGTRHVYVNGVEQALTGSAITVVANDGPITIGQDFDDRFFKGGIDEVRIWSTARTQAEIVSAMTGTLAENTAGLVAYYRFDQGTAGGDNGGLNTLYDRTANAHDATLKNFSLTGTTSNWVASGVPVNGSCGSDNGLTLTTTPINLCSAGIASAVTGTGNPWTWSCNGVTNASCSASIKTWTVTPSAGAHGSISPDTGQIVNHNATAVFTITPDSGYGIASVIGCNGSLTSGTTYTTGQITANCTVTVSFGAIVNGSCGTDNGTTLTATPVNLCATGAASAVAGTGPWTWTCAGANSGTTANCSASIQTYSLTFNTEGNGTLTGTTTQTVNYGASASSVQATPATGYTFVNWTGTNGFVTTSLNPLTVANVTASMTITANFILTQVNGACGSDDNKILAASAATNLCASGVASAVTGTGHPWTWGCTGANGGTSANCSASIQTYTLTFTSDGNGTLTGTSSQTLDHGTSASAVTVVPSTGYHFVNWTGTNGFATTSTNPLVVSSVTATMAITAHFSQDAVNGVCGSSNGMTLAAEPASNLCASGTSSAVSGTDPWTWTCTGLNGGTTASCSASVATAVPSGDLTGDGTVTAADALKALRIASGLDTASSSDLAKGDVAPLVSGIPASDGAINIGDVVVILRKAVGLVTW